MPESRLCAKLAFSVRFPSPGFHFGMLRFDRIEKRVIFMKKVITSIVLFILLLCSVPVSSEELPEGFYDSELVKNAVQEQIKQFRQFTPAQVEVIYLASKILHDEYFENDNIIRIPQGEYLIGELIKPGSYRFSLGDSDLSTLWVEKPGKFSNNYYSMNKSTDKTEVILRLEEGWTFRVTYADVYMSEIEEF